MSRFDSEVMDSSIVTSLQYEVDDLHRNLEHKLEYLIKINERTEFFIDVISKRKKSVEEKRRREIVNIKPHHNNYEPEKVKKEFREGSGNTYNVNKPKAVVPDEEDSSPVSSSFNPPRSGSFKFNEQGKESRNKFERKKPNSRMSRKKPVKKKRLPLHVSKKTVKRRKEKRVKRIENVDKLDSVLQLARRTRDMMQKKKDKTRIRDQFIKKPVPEEIEEPTNDKKSRLNNDTFRKSKNYGKKKMRSSKESQPSRILKSNVPINRRKLKKEMEEIEESYSPMVSTEPSNTSSSLSRMNNNNIIHEQQPKQEEEKVSKRILEEEEEDVMSIITPPIPGQKSIEQQIRLIRKKLKKVQEVKSNMEKVGRDFVSKNISPFEEEEKKENSQELIDLCFQLGIFDYLKTVNEILFQSESSNSNNNEKENEDQKIEEEEEKKKKKTCLSRIEKELGFVNTFMNETQVMKEYETKCLKLMYPELFQEESSKNDDEDEDEIKRMIVKEYVSNQKKKINDQLCNNNSPTNRFIWLPHRIYQNIEHLLHPKHLMITPQNNKNNILSYTSKKQIRKLYDLRGRLQIGLLHHYIEKIVSKNFCDKNNNKLLLLQQEKKKKEFLVYWRFLHSVLTQTAKSECTFIKLEKQKQHQQKEEEEEEDFFMDDDQM